MPPTTTAPSGSSGTQTATANVSAGSDKVTFAFNPAAMKFNTTAQTTSKTRATDPQQQQSGPGGSSVVMSSMSDVLSLGEVTLTLDNVYLVGTTTKDDILQLLRWTQGTKESGGSELTALVFQWGNSRYDVKLKQVNATVERFSSTGSAIRATCNLTFTLITLPQKGTNPSSRGEPGGTHHQVIDGETVCRVAERGYGHPRYWRQVAEANGLDDPLRLRAGRTLYLPPPDKVRRAAALAAEQRR